MFKITIRYKNGDKESFKIKATNEEVNNALDSFGKSWLGKEDCFIEYVRLKNTYVNPREVVSYKIRKLTLWFF
jgi:hypothetical protein